jgi:hypothetical protein
MEFERQLAMGSAPTGRYRVVEFEGGSIYSPSGLGGTPVIVGEHIDTGERVEFCGDSVASMLHDTETLDYLRTLRLGERVIETGSNAKQGRRGFVVESSQGDGYAIQWDAVDGEPGRMTTSPTWTTKRVADI